MSVSDYRGVWVGLEREGQELAQPGPRGGKAADTPGPGWVPPGDVAGCRRSQWTLVWPRGSKLSGPALLSGGGGQLSGANLCYWASQDALGGCVVCSAVAQLCHPPMHADADDMQLTG